MTLSFATRCCTAVSLLFATSAYAQETVSNELPAVIVSANRVPTVESQVASSVSVVTAQEIETRQWRTLPDILQHIPGLQLVQSGGPGAVTSVFIRGTNSNHTKVILDGIEVNDPSSPNNAFEFSNILASDIERVEVLRGAQSAVYGSDAIGGVISIITKKGKGAPSLRGSVEGGSNATFNQSAGISGSQERINYAFDIGHFRTGSTQATPLALVTPGNPRNSDAYDNLTLSTKLGTDITDDLSVGIVGRYVESELDFTQDGFAPEALRSHSDNNHIYSRAFADWSTFEGKFDQTLGVSYGDNRRRTYDPNAGTFTPYSSYTGDRTGLDWQGDLYLSDRQTFTLGLDHEWETIDADTSSSAFSANTYNTAGFVELHSAFSERFFNTVSLRRDEHDDFGGKTTYRIAPSYLFPETGTKLKASYGTGFKAPTLTQLYDNTFGSANPDLRPEESKGFDLGFEQAVLGEKVQFGSTFFHNTIDDLIAFDAFFVNANINKAKTWGFENFVTYSPLRSLDFRADYTYTRTEDESTGADLLRRPKHKASLTSTWHATEQADFSTVVTYIGDWTDAARDFSVPRLQSDDYLLVNLAGSYDLGNGITAFGRIDNLLNETYENPVGYEHPGIGFFAGLRATYDGLSGGKR